MDISAKPVNDFLDAVDEVMNSNTFILRFHIFSEDVKKSLEPFLKSENFINQLLAQDGERDWFNMQYFDDVTASFIIKPGNTLNENFELIISGPSVDKREYLIAMLTGDTSVGNFFSFYSKQKERKVAEAIVDDFVSYLPFSGNYELFTMKPNFLKNTYHSSAKENEIQYFDGDYGNDTATVITCGDTGYLILTNGVD